MQNRDLPKKKQREFSPWFCETGELQEWQGWEWCRELQALGPTPPPCSTTKSGSIFHWKTAKQTLCCFTCPAPPRWLQRTVHWRGFLPKGMKKVELSTDRLMTCNCIAQTQVFKRRLTEQPLGRIFVADGVKHSLWDNSRCFGLLPPSLFVTVDSQKGPGGGQKSDWERWRSKVSLNQNSFEPAADVQDSQWKLKRFFLCRLFNVFVFIEHVQTRSYLTSFFKTVDDDFPDHRCPFWT